jgi:uncharacterized protein YrrD
VQRISELIGRTILTADTGERVGAVSDLVLEDTRLVGVVVGGGWFAGERVLPFAEVQALGRDALIARSHNGLVDARTWKVHEARVSRSSQLKDKPVVTQGGRQIGTVRDVFVDERSGLIEAYEIAGRRFAGLVARHATLPQAGDITIGPDVVVVSDQAAEAFEADARGQSDAEGDGR